MDEILINWTSLDPIRYLIIATILLGLMKSIKMLVRGKI